MTQHGVQTLEWYCLKVVLGAPCSVWLVLCMSPVMGGRGPRLWERVRRHNARADRPSPTGHIKVEPAGRDYNASAAIPSKISIRTTTSTLSFHLPTQRNKFPHSLRIDRRRLAVRCRS